MKIKNCGNCRHWVDLHCRAGAPLKSEGGRGIWPATAETDWCDRFKAAALLGAGKKVSDEQILEVVRNYDRPGDRIAIARTELVFFVKELGLTTTPILRRVEKLVRMGLLVVGDEPPEDMRKTDPNAGGLHVWLGEAKAPAVEKEKAKSGMEVFTEAFIQVASTPRWAKSVRGVQKAIAEILPLSPTSVHRKLQALVDQGVALKNADGYYAAPVVATATEKEVEL